MSLLLGFLCLLISGLVKSISYDEFVQQCQEKYQIRGALAKYIEWHQSNTDFPIMTYDINRGFGMGSDIHQWSEKLCYALENGYRLRTVGNSWQWADQENCKDTLNLACYTKNKNILYNENIANNRIALTVQSNETSYFKCRGDFKKLVSRMIVQKIKKYPDMLDTTSFIRAASIEYLFGGDGSNGLSDVLLKQMYAQIQKVFKKPDIPSNLINVHIRWGDKKREMKLHNVEEYIDAVNDMIKIKNIVNLNKTTENNIYVSSDDTNAITSFKNEAPKNWNIFTDPIIDTILNIDSSKDPNAQNPYWFAHQTQGKMGLISLSSLLIACESNYHVLTTGSNWSRLMNEVRKNINDKHCNGCTYMIDLEYGEYRR